MRTYKIITNKKVFDEHIEENWQDILYSEQEAKCSELGIDMNYLAGDVTIHFFDSPFFDEYTTKMSVYEAIECLAIKDGADLVQYDNGNYGFVAYYNRNVNGFEIIRRESEMNKIKLYNIEWDTDGEIIDDLPTEVIIDKPTEEMIEAVGGFDDVLADYLSDKYGFCVFGFDADFC